MTTPAWQPPVDFQSLPSALKGITVYAPRPEVELQQADSPTTFKCPNCGATTRYDIAAGGVACEHCSHTATPQADQVGRKAQEFEFTLETLEQAKQGWGVARRELHCESCGASLTLAEGSITATCPFCASNQVNVRAAPSDVLRPRFLIPFKVLPEALRARAAEWLGKGWYHPDDLARAAALDRFVGIYLPFWTFDAIITASWRAEVGYPRQHRHYNASSRRWETRTRIEWRWESGRAMVDVDDLIVPGTTHASRIILNRLTPFNLNELVAYTPDYLAGWQAQAYDITLPNAWETGKALMREHAKAACRDQIRSSHVRNFSMAADFADETWRYVLLPVYLAAYQFEARTFQVMVNGQTGAVAGQKPVAWWKIWLAIAAMLLPGGLVELISLPLLLAGGLGVVTAMIGLVLLIIGGVFAFRLYQQAKESEAA